MNKNIQFEPSPQILSIKTAYLPEEAKTYDQKRFTSTWGKVIHDIEITKVKEALCHIHKEAILLEVGCGTGRIMEELARENYRVDGTDASLEMLNLCRGKFIGIKTPPTLCHAEAANLPHQDCTYDMVFCIRLLNQTESKDYAMRVISEMIRTTKKDGYILVEFLNSFRPAIRKKTRRNVFLRPLDVVQQGKVCGASLIWNRGAFFLSMGFFRFSPSYLLKFLKHLDKSLSHLFPKFCTRSYILFQKQ